MRFLGHCLKQNLEISYFNTKINEYGQKKVGIEFMVKLDSRVSQLLTQITRS